MRPIDADALMAKMAGFVGYCDKCLVTDGDMERRYLNCNECYLDALDNAPTIDAEPVKHSEWVETYQEDVMFEGTYKCSRCGEMYLFTYGTPEDNKYNYCPHCGAKMDGGKEKDNENIKL